MSKMILWTDGKKDGKWKRETKGKGRRETEGDVEKNHVFNRKKYRVTQK